MQKPPNSYSQYPQQQWQQQPNYAQLQTYYPPQQQWQQPPMPPQQQWNPQQPPYPPPQYQPPIQRPKRNRVVLWVSGGITCVVLVVLVVVGSVLIGHSFFFSPSHSGEMIFTSTQYTMLHTEYSGTITDPATTSPMGLIITSNDNKGHISGRVGILVVPNGGDPFIGTLGVDKTITFTATPLLIGVLTVFTGKVKSDGSISGTTSNDMYQPETWKLFPVKGH